MATTAEKRAYARALLDVARRSDRLERDTLRAMVAALRELRRALSAELAAGEFADWRLRELTRTLDQLMASVEAAMRQAAQGGVVSAASLGAASVVEPLTAAGVTVRFFAPTPQQVQVLSDFSADLIGGITAEVRRSINAQLRLGALGGSTPHQVMQQVTRILGLSPRHPGGAAYRAERIVRTELTRVYNVAAHGAMGEVEGAGKRWIATGDERTRTTHLQAHLATLENPIPVDQPYRVGGSLLQYPGDPAGSAEETINCRCRSVVVHPDVGVIVTRLDDAIQTKKEAR